MDMIGVDYNVQLQLLVKQIKRDIDATLMAAIRSMASDYVQDAWPDQISNLLAQLAGRWTSQRIEQLAQRLASDFVQSSVRYSERKLRRSHNIDVFSNSEKMRDYLQASTLQNAQLIKSIPAKYLEEVHTLVMSNMRAGMRPGYIERALQEQFGVTQRRAKFIARDQTGKIQGELAERQQRDAGFEHFQWVDSHDQRVRHRHHVINDKVTAYGPGVYRWDNLPLSDEGEPIKPGGDFNCRCTPRPVSAREVERNRAAGKTAPGVYR